MFLKLWQSWCHYHFPGRPGSDHPLCEESFLNVQPELMKQLLAISLSVDTGKEIYVSMRMYAYMYVSVNHLTVSIYKSKWIDRYMYDVDPSITWAQMHSLHKYVPLDLILPHCLSEATELVAVPPGNWWLRALRANIDWVLITQSITTIVTKRSLHFMHIARFYLH